MKRFEDAVRTYDKALEIGPLPEDKAHWHCHQILAFSALGRAVCLDALGRDAEAEAAWRTYEKIYGRKPDEPDWFRAHRFAMYGRPEKGVRYLEERRLHESEDNGMRYNVACAYAAASGNASISPALRNEYAAKALGQLKKAQAGGYFNSSAQRRNVRKDLDLDPLRGREDFEKWLAELAAAESKSDK